MLSNYWIEMSYYQDVKIKNEKINDKNTKEFNIYSITYEDTYSDMFCIGDFLRKYESEE